MWFSFASLGRTFPAILCNYGKSSIRRQSSGTKRVLRPWNHDEDHKLTNLRRNGFSLGQISAEMNRSYLSIENRLITLRRGDDKREARVTSDPDTSPITRKKRGQTLWSAEEVALLREKHDQGLSQLQIASFFPTRSLSSVRGRINDMTSTSYDHQLKVQGRLQHKRTFTDAQVQRVIDLRLKEAKTLIEIAPEFNCTHRAVSHLWRTRCLPIMSDMERDICYGYKAWTPEEVKHLFELQRRGTMSTSDAALHFPSKTANSVSHKAYRLRLQFVRRPAKQRSTSLPTSDIASAASDEVKTELEP